MGHFKNWPLIKCGHFLWKSCFFTQTLVSLELFASFFKTLNCRMIESNFACKRCTFVVPTHYFHRFFSVHILMSFLSPYCKVVQYLFKDKTGRKRISIQFWEKILSLRNFIKNPRLYDT